MVVNGRSMCFFHKQDESFMWFMGPGLYNMLPLKFGWVVDSG